MASCFMALDKPSLATAVYYTLQSNTTAACRPTSHHKNRTSNFTHVRTAPNRNTGNVHRFVEYGATIQTRPIARARTLCLSSVSHLQALDQVPVRPADLLREASEHAEAAAGGHLDHLKGVGHNHALLLVVGGRDALEALHRGKGKEAKR